MSANSATLAVPSRVEAAPVDDSCWLSVQRFLAKEALSLDDKDWDAWLALYHHDAEYWVPAWDDDGLTTRDPQAEISLIYYHNRGGLEDRVFRIRTGRSSATTPPLRTCHLFNLLDVTAQEGGVRARTSWTVHAFREEDELSYFGSAEYDLVGGDGDGWLIRRKKTIVLNDRARTLLDVYTI